jgi:hypothetical protein
MSQKEGGKGLEGGGREGVRRSIIYK